MPQHCLLCPRLETALGRSEAGKEFIKFLTLWLKCRQYKAQAVVTDGELRCFVKFCPVFWGSAGSLQTCPETSYPHSVHNVSGSERLQ